jgi:hypothetical protein
VFGYKAEFEPSDQQIKEAQASFENTDRQVAVFESTIDFNTAFWRTARKVVSRLTGDADLSKIVPFHGPGAVFPPCNPSERTLFKTIHARIEPYYPYWEFFNGMMGFRPNADEIYQEDICDSSSPIKGKLVYVPKDSRGPRSICVHPKESIWIQQGQRAVLEPLAVSRSGRRINFEDQTINGKLALRSSLSREYATLDLKDASDRLGCRVVKHLFASQYDILSCTRMEEVILPDGRVIALNKWAPMGNALCFPVESICFFALARTGIEAKYGRDAALQVYVFGDDIIVPSRCVDGAIDGLEQAGLLVNKQKSFSRGFFRESCGVDAFKGLDVTPLRMKKHKITAMSDLLSLCAFAKNLRAEGFENSSSYLYSYCRQYLRRRGMELSITNDPDVTGVAEYVPCGLDKLMRYNDHRTIEFDSRKRKYVKRPYFTFRWNEGYQRYEVKTYLAVASTVTESDGWYRLQDSLLSLERRGRSPCISSNAGARRGRTYPVPYRMQLKQGWTPVLMA